jgi:acyl-CoA reductase-like NAD-dependent aldehyde dehydrogenase
VSHPQVPLVSFTGGTATGEVIAKLAAPHHKKLSLELGGKNANIIFEDADLAKAVSTSIRSSFANQGEICLCGSRIFVHEKVYEEFISAFVAQAKQLKVGDPNDPGTNLGPLVSEQHLQKVLSYVKIGREEGGQILCGGEDRLSNYEGYFMNPTIIATKSPKCRVMQDEIFGPVVTVTPFSTEEQVIEWANGVKYGLSASVWTENGKRQRRVAEALRVGTVWVNCWMFRDLSMPFGGMKHSGVGREGGDYSLEFYTEEKTICLSN